MADDRADKPRAAQALVVSPERLGGSTQHDGGQAAFAAAASPVRIASPTA
jgi:hypothetical protein